MASVFDFVVAIFDQGWSIINMIPSPVWDIHIDRPPVVLQMGTPTHGQTRTEKWTNLAFWSLHVYRYSADLRVNDTWYVIEPGMVSILPRGLELEYHFNGPSQHTFVHFNIDPGVAGSPVSISAFQQLDAMYEAFENDLRAAVFWQQSNPPQAQARVWDLLWRLTRFNSAAQHRVHVHPAIAGAIEWIELNLTQPFSIGTLADDMDVSHVHLVRLFKEQVGMTPLAYVHQRRAERATHLLRNTTLPLKLIAKHVGLVDLHQLNKLCRKVLHLSPTAIRQQR
jgi:AraC family transcriptional regulator